MAICASTCSQTLPESYTGGCGITTRPGGIKRLWFAKCNAQPWAYDDDNDWTLAQQSGDVVGTGLLMGQKAKGSFTKKRIASCSPEGIVGAEKSITFMDYNSDTVSTVAPFCKAYTFYNTILNHASSYQFFYETCDGHVYGPITDFILEVDEVIEDNNTGSTYFDGTVSWNDVDMACPVVVSGGITPA